MKAKIWNCSFWVRETEPSRLENLMQETLICAGFHIVGKLNKTFSPQGFTALFLLAESHLAVHTFPEENKTYIELSSCNKQYFENFKAGVAVNTLLEKCN